MKALSFEELARRTPAVAVVASDLSERVALYARRRALRLPLRPAQFLALHADHLPVDYVLLSPAIAGLRAPAGGTRLHQRYRRRYLRLVASPEFDAAYALVAPLPDGSLLFARR